MACSQGAVAQVLLALFAGATEPDEPDGPDAPDGANGADWSLFCPGTGIAAFASPPVSGVLSRPAVASTLGVSLVEPNTEIADGTLVSAICAEAVPGPIVAGWAVGRGGSAGVLSHAPSSNAEQAMAIKVIGVCMIFLRQGSWSARRFDRRPNDEVEATGQHRVPL